MRPMPRHHAPLPMSLQPNDLAPSIATALAAVDDRLRSAWSSLSAERRNTRRADGGWSVCEVLEHIALTNEAYLAPMTVLRDALLRSPRANVRWQPTFAGKWLARSLEMTIPLPAPRRIQPGPSPRAGVLDAVVGTHDAVSALVRQVSETDWRSVRMVSPFNTLVRPNFGDAALAVLRHSERHTAQIEQLAHQLIQGVTVARSA